MKTKTGGIFKGFDQVLVAIGRHPYIETLNLGALGGVETVGQKGHIKTNDFQETSIPNLYALGDVCGKVRNKSIIPKYHTHVRCPKVVFHCPKMTVL